ncbi:YqgQ family protein [Bacillus sp. FJAT-44742]|uniref:YqgQ family protein n=1 Tax=Bacillus sp. FJAT-44742 TaxID=2014005 RepID=UPI000C240F7D|nr:YqgQ family protein [Bacillus sp. FJAT-44742]
MNNLYELKKWMISFGAVIYTKDPLADLDLIEEEVKEAYNMGVLDKDSYQKALLIVRQERNKISREKRGESHE